MLDEIKRDTPGLLGVSFGNKIIYNVIMQEAEFSYSGLSIINYLKYNKNDFVANIVMSQSYNNIKLVFDDSFVFGDFYDITNTNIESFSGVYNLMKESDVFEYFYIYDYIEDMLIIKVPELLEPVALDYKNSKDVRDYLHINN